MNEFERRLKQAVVNEEAAVMTEDQLRVTLEARYGVDNVWDTGEVGENFIIEGFLAPYCTAIRKSDRAKGTLEFTHSPRFYYNFVPQANYDDINDQTKFTVVPL